MENEKRYTKIEKQKTIQKREISLKSVKTIKKEEISLQNEKSLFKLIFVYSKKGKSV